MRFSPKKARREDYRKYMAEERRRVMTVAYEMARGVDKNRPGGAELQKRCDELNVWDMTPEAFEAYRQRVISTYGGVIWV